MLKMIKIIKTKFCPNLDLRCVHILNYTYVWSKPCEHTLNDAFASFGIDSKNHIFIDLIK